MIKQIFDDLEGRKFVRDKDSDEDEHEEDGFDNTGKETGYGALSMSLYKYWRLQKSKPEVEYLERDRAENNVMECIDEGMRVIDSCLGEDRKSEKRFSPLCMSESLGVTVATALRYLD